MVSCMCGACSTCYAQVDMASRQGYQDGLYDRPKVIPYAPLNGVLINVPIAYDLGYRQGQQERDVINLGNSFNDKDWLIR